MQDATRYGARTLSIEEVKNLANRVAAVVTERNELRREIHDLKLIMAEFEALREVIDNDVAGAMATAATSNGHLGSVVRNQGATPPDTADECCDAPEADDDQATMAARSQLCTGETPADERREQDTGDGNDDQAAPHDPGEPHRSDDTAGNDIPAQAGDARETPDADCREQATSADVDDQAVSEGSDAILQNPLVSNKMNCDTGASHTGEPAADRVQAEAPAGDHDERPAAKLCTGEILPPADNSEVAETPTDTAAPDDSGEGPPADDVPVPETPAATVKSHTGETPQRPPAESLMGRILTAIEQSDKPRRGWHIQKELGLPRMPSAELSRLVKRGFLTRHGESVYGVSGRKYEGSKS